MNDKQFAAEMTKFNKLAEKVLRTGGDSFVETSRDCGKSLQAAVSEHARFLTDDMLKRLNAPGPEGVVASALQVLGFTVIVAKLQQQYPELAVRQ